METIHDIAVPAAVAPPLPAVLTASPMAAGHRPQDRDWDESDPRDVARAVMEHLAARLTNPHTVQAYNRAYDDLVKFMCYEDVASALWEMKERGQVWAQLCLIRWQKWLKETRGLSPKSIALWMAGVRKMLNVAKARGLILWELELKSPRIVQLRDVRGLKHEWVMAMIAAAGGSGPDYANMEPTPIQMRDEAIVALLYSTGIRADGLCSLDTEHYDSTYPDGPILWVRWKGYDERLKVDVAAVDQTPETPDAINAASLIDRWLGVRGDWPGPIFVRFTGRGKLTHDRLGTDGLCKCVVKKVARLAGIKRRVYTHLLRHALGTFVANQTHSAFAVKQVLKHSSIATSQIYVDEEEGLPRRMAEKVMGGGK